MAWQLLFSSDIGLLSLFTIVFIIGMGIFLARFFKEEGRRRGWREITLPGSTVATAAEQRSQHQEETT